MVCALGKELSSQDLVLLEREAANIQAALQGCKKLEIAALLGKLFAAYGAMNEARQAVYAETLCQYPFQIVKDVVVKWMQGAYDVNANFLPALPVLSQLCRDVQNPLYERLHKINLVLGAEFPKPNPRMIKRLNGIGLVSNAA